MAKKATDLTGQRFGHWTVLKRGKNVKGQVYWVCECDCGTIRPVLAGSLKNGKSTSCGCHNNQKTSERLLGVWEKSKNNGKEDDMPNKTYATEKRTTNAAGLRECPFCGCDKAQLAESDDRHRPNVVCPVCGVRVYGDTEYLAILRWNMRLGER